MFPRVIVLSLFVLAAPIAVAAETRVDFDRQKDFSRYKTFTLQVDPPMRADGVVDEHNTLAENRLRQAVTREFQARGLEATDGAADLTVHVSSREAERTMIVDSGWNGYPWGWGRRWRYWRGPGYWGPYAGDLWTRRYLEGSVTIDVIERDGGQLVYRAQVIDEIGNNRDKQVIKTVDKAFKKFPVKETSTD
jgi:Domain of unknown function (DUF4136)